MSEGAGLACSCWGLEHKEPQPTPPSSLHSSVILWPQTKEHPRPEQTCETYLGQMPNAAATWQLRIRSTCEWAQYLGPRDYLTLEWVSKKRIFLEQVFLIIWWLQENGGAYRGGRLLLTYDFWPGRSTPRMVHEPAVTSLTLFSLHPAPLSLTKLFSLPLTYF